MRAAYRVIIAAALVPCWTGIATATTFVFEEDFESPTWEADVGGPGSAATWTYEGATDYHGPMLDGTEFPQFADGDPRIGGASHGSLSGGITHSATTPPPDTPVNYDGGDNEEIYLDFHMQVPNGEYFFNVELDQVIYWAEADVPAYNQSWSQGHLYYIGDSDEMAYGSQERHRAPEGPWLGYSWTRNTTKQDDLRISPMIWNSGFDEATDEGYCGDPANPGECGVCNSAAMPTVYTNGTDPACSSRNNGVWVHHAWSQHRDGSDVINVDTGEVIFRFAIRNKRADTARIGHAIDNLVVTLTTTLDCPDPFADVDEDGDADATDFAALQRCLTGADDPGDVFDRQLCGCFDRDLDEDVDQQDVLAFNACVQGPALPVAPGCGGDGP